MIELLGDALVELMRVGETTSPPAPRMRGTMGIAALSDADPEAFAALIREAYGIEFWLRPPMWGNEYEPDIVRLESIVVPHVRRNEGIGTSVMGELAAWANRHGFIVSLMPSGDFGGNVKRLRRFYRRFGFVPNRGRKKDFRTRDAFIRYPRPKNRPKASSVAAPTARSRFTGWSCPLGPAELVDWLVEVGEEVDYETFERGVVIREFPYWWEGIANDWSVAYFVTELPSGRRAWVGQGSGIEYLFTQDGSFDGELEGALAIAFGEYLAEHDEDEEEDWPTWFSDLSRDQIAVLREMFISGREG